MDNHPKITPEHFLKLAPAIPGLMLRPRLARGVYFGLVMGLSGVLGIFAAGASAKNPPCQHAQQITLGRGIGDLEPWARDLALTVVLDPETDTKYVAGKGIVITVYEPIVPCPVTETTATLDALGGDVKMAITAPGPSGNKSIVAIDTGDNLLYFLEGHGGGTLGAPVTYPTGGSSPSSVTVGNLGTTGAQAAFITNLCASSSTCPGPGGIAVFQINSNGTVQPAVTYLVGALPTGIVSTSSCGADPFATPAQPRTCSLNFYGSGPIPPPSAQKKDFNGDGVPDLVVANYGDNAVSVLLGNADGTFQTQRTFATAAGPASVVVGDFDGDGNLDLAVTATSPFPGVVSVLLGNGDGTFQTHVDYPVGTNPYSMTIGDFNRDGKLDLAIANLSDNTISILTGKGDGTFQTHVEYSSGGVFPSFITTLDENGDGVPDLIIANKGSGSGDTNVVTLFGIGDGTFEAPADYATGALAPSIAAGDVNGDGKPDLIVPNGTDNKVSILLNSGDGTFALGTPLSTSFPGANYIATGDFNGDHKLDLAVTHQGTTVDIFLGNGNGTFQAPTNLVVGSTVSILSGDFDGDGNLDLAFGSFGTAVSVALGNGNGTFATPVPYTTGAFAQALATADFNHDDKLDLAVSGTNGISILLGNGNGTFQTHQDFALPSGPALFTPSLAAGDFDGDGKMDLAATSGNGVSIFLGNGDGTFQANVDYPAGFPFEAPKSLIAIDFNGDDILDLEVTGPDNTVYLLVGNGDGTFQPPAHFGNAKHSNAVVAGDFNGDGIVDLAVARADGMVSVFLNSFAVEFVPSHLTFANQSLGTTSPAQTAKVWNPGPAPLSLGAIHATGDFDQTNTCGTSLALQATCAINITFTPTAGGARTGAVTIADGAPNSPHTLALSGVSAVTGVTLAPDSLTFTSQAVGTPSPSQPVTFTNNGSSPLSISHIGASGDFAQTNDCGVSLGAGANCTIDVTFTPTAAGNRIGTLSITDSDPSSPQTLSLSGTGTAPAVSLSSSSLTFSGQLAGTTSAAQPVTLTNTGSATLTITSLATSAQFNETSDCGSTLAPGAHCTIHVTFSPNAVGSFTGTLTITDDAPGSPQAVSLSGAGTGPEAHLSAASLSFGDQPIGSTSPAQTATLTNTGTADLTVSTSALSGANAGDFAMSADTCSGATIVPAHTCAVSVTFTPSAAGSRSALLKFTDNAPNSPQTVTLNGAGAGPEVSLSPTSLTFPPQNSGTSSSAQTVTLTNTGHTSLTISSIAASGDFTQTNTCGGSVSAGANCTISVTFTPTATGTRTGALTISDNASGSPHAAGLTGTGQDFNLVVPSGSSTSATAAAGQAAAYNLSVGGEGGLSGAITFTCSGAPAKATCTVSPNPATAGSTPTTVTVTVNTTAPAAAGPRSPLLPRLPPLRPDVQGLGTLALLLAAMTWILLRRKQLGMRRWTAGIGTLALGLLLAFSVAACRSGGIRVVVPGTPPGVYTLTVTGTAGSGSSAVSHSVTLTLNVT